MEVINRHHYCFATEFLGKFPDYEPVHDGINKAAAGFVLNLLRIQSLGRLPILLLGAGLALQHFDAEAARSLKLLSTDVLLNKASPSFNPALYEEKEKRRKLLQGKWFEETQKGKIATGMDIGANVLTLLASTGEPETNEGIDAILMGMITGMWTAFEVLVEMVWDGAVRERPNLGYAGMTPKERDASGFRSTKRFRLRYSYTFRTDEKPIFKSLADDRIDALSLTRNIIVHTGGKVDKDFIKRGRNIAALACFSNIPEDEKIKLTGPIVLDLIQPIPALGFQLVKAVDEWITSHP